MDIIAIDQLIDKESTFQMRHRHYVMFTFIGIISIVQMFMQIVYSISTNNLFYLISCILFGPFHLIASLLAISIKFRSSSKVKYKLALWTLRMLTLGFIPFINVVTLNSLYIADCNMKTETQLYYCEYVLLNIFILILDCICFSMDVVFCYNFNSS